MNTNTEHTYHPQLSSGVLIHQSYECFISECKGIVEHFKVQLIKVNKATNVVIAESLKVPFYKDRIRSVSFHVFVIFVGLW